MTALLAFLTTIAFCIAAFFLMRGATASLREDMKAAFGVLHEAERQSPGYTRSALLKIVAAVLVAGLLAALTGCGEKKPPEVDQKLVDWFVAHEAEGRAELKQCAELAKGKTREWADTEEGLRCQAANRAGYSYKAAPLGEPRYFKGGSK